LVSNQLRQSGIGVGISCSALFNAGNGFPERIIVQDNGRQTGQHRASLLLPGKRI